MRRRIHVLVAAGLLTGLFSFGAPLTVYAGTQGASCGLLQPRVLAYENGIGDTSDGDDRLWICGGGGPSRIDLEQVAHTLPGNCKSGLFGESNWSNCITSAAYWLPVGVTVCWYRGPHDFDNSWVERETGPYLGARFNTFESDSYSSVGFNTC